MQEHTRKTQQDAPLFFEPVTVIRDVLRRWYLVVCVALLCGMGTYLLSDLTYSPSYTTSTTFVVTARGSSTTVYQNLSAASNLATVFEEVLNSSLLRAAILQELEMTSFDGAITASAIPDTNLLTMQVTASDPRTAFLVTRAIIEHHQVVSGQVIGEDTVLEVLQQPKVPAAPANSRNALSLARRAVILSAGAMCLLLGALSCLRDAVRSKQEAEDKLLCPCLGVIRHERKYKTLIALLRRRKTSILITRPSTSFHFSESIRKLRRRVEQRLEKRQVLLVTSVLENEGKSTIAVNLALSLAQKGHRVLLIDCDLRKPACYKLLERTCRGHGTMDVIAGRSELDRVIVRDEATGLDLLLEHKSVHSATNLVGSAGMEALLAACRKVYDYIILDLPPMFAAPDTESVLDFVDAALLVVQQNAATATQINNAAAALNARPGRLLGCVLNNVHSSPLSQRSSYGYGYGYGHYGKYGKYGSYGSTDSIQK